MRITMQMDDGFFFFFHVIKFYFIISSLNSVRGLPEVVETRNNNTDFLGSNKSRVIAERRRQFPSSNSRKRTSWGFFFFFFNPTARGVTR